MLHLNPSYTGLRMDVLEHIQGINNVVLDVGCAIGENGKYLLKEKQAISVYGVEFDAEMATIASKSNTKIFQGDLNDFTFRKEIIANSPEFDYIIFADVLEHLLEPEKILKELLSQLKPSGKVIISLPNVAHIETFIQLYVKGTWPKNPRGIFDSTHLRWFTKKDAFKMIMDSGLHIIKYIPKLRARDSIGSEFNWKYNFIKWINKDWVTFQHILICSNES
tara:strand:+ start:334 stop:996 length:663 start_codon:yes stop_codon:yes gene_type:complete